MMQERATGAELFLRSIAQRGVEFLFLNPGTDTFPVQEAYAKLSAAGEPLPRLLMCPFENLASSAAQGAYLASGQAQVALVHVDVGTANAAGSLNDAKANRAAVLLCAGRSPLSLEDVPGGRSKYINWLQDVPDQAALVRNYVKNEQIAYRPEAIPTVVQRALQVAESDPAGPTYITLARESLMEMTELGGTVDAARFPAVRAGAPRDDDLEQLADWLLQADNPTLVAGYLGRDVAAVDALVRLSELVGAGVVEYRGRVNFPLSHPHHLGFDLDGAAHAADLLVVLEHDVAYVPVSAQVPTSTKMVHVGSDPFFETIQTWGFPSDLGIRADARLVLEELVAILEGRITAPTRARVEQRRERLARNHQEWTRDAWRPADERPGQPVSPVLVGQILHELLPANAAIFEEAVTAANPIALQLRDVQPGCYFRNGGSYLGWAVGAAIGYGLSRQDHVPVAVVGDGSFLFSVPSASLWLASTSGVPLLTVVVDNGAYNSTRLAGRDGYPDGWQERVGHVGSDFVMTPRADLLAQACGMSGFVAEDADTFRTALKAAAEEVSAGRPALVSVKSTRAARPV